MWWRKTGSSHHASQRSEIRLGNMLGESILFLLSGKKVILSALFMLFIFPTFTQNTMKKFIQLSDSITIEYEELSIEDAQDLIKTFHGNLILDLSTDKRKTHLFENEQVLVVYDKQAFLYSSQADIGKLLNGPMSRSILNGLNPYNERFPENVSKLIKDLLHFLNLNGDSYDLNELFLRKVDGQMAHLINTKGKSASEFMNYTIHFIALAGEVFKTAFGGQWKMIQADDGTWQPYICFDGREVDLFVWIYESINDSSMYPSIYNGYQAKTISLFRH
ncbi:MAG: hypothetical protein JJU02_14120 [Cryomorphaceae bacterium]|nr:hypothetical protein [Cryomorphaceae bacterium]